MGISRKSPEKSSQIDAWSVRGRPRRLGRLQGAARKRKRSQPLDKTFPPVDNSFPFWAVSAPFRLENPKKKLPKSMQNPTPGKQRKSEEIDAEKLPKWRPNASRNQCESDEMPGRLLFSEQRLYMECLLQMTCRHPGNPSQSTPKASRNRCETDA